MREVQAHVDSPKRSRNMKNDFPTASVGSSQALTATVEKSHSHLEHRNTLGQAGSLSARWAPALMVGAALLAAIVIVDPFREFMSQDDGWAYARSVEHLVLTGQYRLDAWSAANMPVQIYLAAGLAKVFGYSFSILRISTLLLLVAALGAFYASLRDWALPAWPAAVLTLALLASPLVLMLSFTFMSDIQFIGWLLVALWLYGRGFEGRSDLVVMLGSFAAACAVGTRQFGMALISGLIIAWILSRPATRPPLRRLFLATALPLMVSVWQLHAGLSEPNFTQAVRLNEQAYFLNRPLPVMAHELGWRLSTVLQYLGLSLMPALPLLASLCLGPARPLTSSTVAMAAKTTAPSVLVAAPSARRWSRRTDLLLALGTLVGLMLFSLTPSDISTRENAGRALPLWWMLPTAFWNRTWLMRGFAGAGVLNAFLLLLLFWRWRGTGVLVRDLSWPALLVGATGLCLVALHISYVQLNDTYIVGLLPFVLLAIGGALAHRFQPLWIFAATLVWSIAMLVLLGAWMRGDYNRQQTQWAAADQLVASGMPPRCIGGTRHWMEYHGAFDDWLAATYPDFDRRRGARLPPPPSLMQTPFYNWMETRAWNASYQLSSGFGDLLHPDWDAIAEVPYRTALFTTRSIQVGQRQTPRPEPLCPFPTARK